MTALKTITSPSGARFTVAAEHADRFQALVNDLEASGYPIKADQSGGYNPRNIAGTNKPSLHSYGRAIDINWTENARGKPGSIPQDVALKLAKKHGLSWGGQWANRDDMHFEVPDTAPRPMGDRGLTSFAGLTAPKTEKPAPVPTQETASMDPMTMIMSLFGGGGGPVGGKGGSMPFGFKPSGVDLEDPVKKAATPSLVSGPQKPMDMSALMQLASMKRRGGIG